MFETEEILRISATLVNQSLLICSILLIICQLVEEQFRNFKALTVKLPSGQLFELLSQVQRGPDLST